MKPRHRHLVAFIVLSLCALQGCAARSEQRQSESVPSGMAKPGVSEHAMLRVENPQPGAVIRSPLEVRGAARGPWYFEGDFPLILKDDQGHVIARGFASAQGKWMTTGFVPFFGTLEFSEPSASRGRLILQKDNPSERRELDDAVVIPVRFE